MHAFLRYAQETLQPFPIQSHTLCLLFSRRSSSTSGHPVIIDPITQKEASAEIAIQGYWSAK